jgi:RNA polymerase sigma factor (sigma-70 family)
LLRRESGWEDSLGLPGTTSAFESAVLEQMDAAYNLARWLVHNNEDAQDVVQESCMKALRGFDSFRDGDFRAWFLTIVRNTSFTLISRRKGTRGSATQLSADVGEEISADVQEYDPQAIAIRASDAAWVRGAIDLLPETLREVVVLREMEGLSYKEIGRIAGIPIGTVMSRLARGRTQLQALLVETEQNRPGVRGPEGGP